MKKIALLLLVSGLAGCGSSRIVPVQLPNNDTVQSSYNSPSSSVKAENSLPSLRMYNRILIADFGNVTKDRNNQTINFAGQSFADTLASHIRRTGVFEVSRDLGPMPQPGDLILSGAITRYEEGHAFTRYMVGFGAGTSHFEADVSLVDPNGLKTLGQFRVDRNSWPLGGAYAAHQNVDTHMTAAAEFIAKKLQEAKSY